MAEGHTMIASLSKTERRSASALVVLLITTSSMLAGAQTKAGLGEIEAAIRACSGATTALARARIHRGEAGVVAAGVLPNPAIMINQNQSLTGPKDRETIVALAVPIALGGAWFLLRDAAGAERQALLLMAGEGSFAVAVEVRERFARASLAQMRLAALREKEEGLGALIGRLSALEAGGEAAAYDVLRLEAEQAEVRVAMRRAASDLAAERAWLATVVDDAVTIEPGAAKRLHDDVTRAHASKNGEHPMVASLRAQAEAERLRAEAADRRWAPDLEVVVGYRNVGGGMAPIGHGLSLGLTVPLTFFDHGQGEAHRARARAEINEASAVAARQRFTADRRAAEARGATLADDREDAGAEALAERWVVASQKLYAAGEGSLLDVLEALRARAQARMARLELLERQIDAHVAWMRSAGVLAHPRLEAACGISRKEEP
jgi:outer membrane protein, heavy metal efflux system